MKPTRAPVSTTNFILITVFFAMVAVPQVNQAHGQDAPIGPYKDRLFENTSVLKRIDDGDFEVIDYQEMRDINGRDKIPERRVKSRYVSTGVKRHQVDETLAIANHRLEVTRVGPERRSAFTVIFIHGRGGDRRLGVNDFSFGGNFNRLKNLIVDNGGTYYSPSVTTFDDAGAADIAALISHTFKNSGGRPVILACASMGGIICARVSRQADAVQKLAGMVILGGPPDAGYPSTPAARDRLPLYLSHGSGDGVYKVADQIAVYRHLHDAGYPVKMSVFNTGSHGTPIRMTDWRKVLNFLLTAD